jgi:hypothetical protein
MPRIHGNGESFISPLVRDPYPFVSQEAAKLCSES